MFALGIRYLMDRAVATRWNAREEPEWPPHPDRIFMALVAAHGETGESEDEKEALLWLEALATRPTLWASQRVSERIAVTAYVPVNDTADPVQKNKPVTPMGSLPMGRIRQPRQFPTVVPDDPSVYLIWSAVDAPAHHRSALERLCAKVTYLGHSSTPVQLWIEDAPPVPNLLPHDGPARYRLRVFGPGRIQDLRASFALGRRPLPSLWQGYAEPDEVSDRAEAHSLFEENLIILRQVEGRRFALESGLMLGQALRGALMVRVGRSPAPEWLSGHQPTGEPSRREHLAIVPLAFVGREHADGHLLGLGLAVPRELPDADIAELMSLLEAEPGYSYVRLTLGKLGECSLELDDRADTARPLTLRPSTYTDPACQWATVTPLVFERFPRRNLTAEEVVADACVRARLPRPAAVRVGRAPFLPGVPNAGSFPALPQRGGRPPRPLTHALLTFDQPLRGPVLIGAGRYLGYGLCRPFESGAEGHDVCHLDQPRKEGGV